MNKDELPPLEFDAKFEGYDYFDPRAFWEKVASKGHDPVPPPRPPKPADPGEDSGQAAVDHKSAGAGVATASPKRTGADD